MERASMVGSRIRERRVMQGMKQADLARAAGISASYLNLIEHNRRRIGGKTLNQLAEVLDVAPGLLAEGAEAALLSALRDAGSGLEDGPYAAPELDRVEEFAGRFPGWARLVADLVQQRDDLTKSVNALTDRIAHDPELASSLHEVISTVTAIRSTASILADGQSLEPQWQSRFHRNINEDSERLASEAEQLVRYLEGAPGSEMVVRSPMEQLQAFMLTHRYHFSALEGPGGSARIASIVSRSDELASDVARRMAQSLLQQYVQDARALPLGEMAKLVQKIGLDPGRISDATGTDLATVARRLASLPEDAVGPVGLFVCDGTGRMILQKPALGIDMPRTDMRCVHWPIFEVLGHPAQVIQRRIRQGEARVLALGISQQASAPRVNRPAQYHAHMLILPDPGPDAAGPLFEVGSVCLLCTTGECEANSAANPIPA
jgi:transcriptional regulator with XRE-family HTH domain/antitoxin component HigA of HigAB toxin-antitoxin module